MLIRTIDESWSDQRGGQTSFLLLGSGGQGSDRLSVTWVLAPAGSEQARHDHPTSEQAYVIIAGRGLMMVEDEMFEVAPGTLVLLEPGETHSIRGVSEEPLVYVTATAPPLEISPRRWSTPLRRHSETKARPRDE
jgi:mannose-6-phosphate isomerase-like protein (cupin superfamily)